MMQRQGERLLRPYGAGCGFRSRGVKRVGEKSEKACSLLVGQSECDMLSNGWLFSCTHKCLL
jgi:hypothetical protein